jgi:hypothetical protein
MKCKKVDCRKIYFLHITHCVTHNAQTAFHGQEHMRQHEVATRSRRIRTHRVWYETHRRSLYALAKLLSGVNNVGVDRVFMEPCK